MAPGQDETPGPGGWAEVARGLSARPVDELDGDELETLSDALFWLDRIEESKDVRRRAYQVFAAATADDPRAEDRAALATWRLFYEHHLVGEAVVAQGWLERCRRHTTAAVDPTVEGWLAVAEADLALRTGDVEFARRLTERAVRIGRDGADPDLTAMALQINGRAEIGRGDRQGGLARLDEAMVSVINEELRPLFTGWVYCAVIACCYGLADLRRADEWSRAALRWCATLREGLMYPGLCRIYAADLARLRGDWSQAASDAVRAGDELLAHDPRYAGEAFYLQGDLARLRGDDAAAEACLLEAGRLGRDPQPALALLRARQGRADEALRTLRSALQPGPADPLPRIEMLSALLEVAVGLGDLAAVREAVAGIDALDAAWGGRIVGAHASAARGRLAVAEARHFDALAPLREAATGFQELGLPFEAARERLALAAVAAELGDRETARMQAAAAEVVFAGLPAPVDAAAARTLLVALDPTGRSGSSGPAAPGEPDAATTGSSPTRPPAAPESPTSPASPADRAGLTDRELQVLRLAAEGHTNREIGERLHLSRHTVARHVSNTLAKLGVGSRTAATSAASRRGLLDPVDGQP